MPGGQRAWPHDRVLALYWYLRLDPVANGRVMGHDAATTRAAHSGCTRIVAFLCDMGAAIDTLPMLERRALESRWSAWDRAAYCTGKIAELCTLRRHELSQSSKVAVGLELAAQEFRNLRAHYREHHRRIEQQDVYRSAQTHLANELLTRDLVARSVDHRLGLTLIGDKDLTMEELGIVALDRLHLAVERHLAAT